MITKLKDNQIFVFGSNARGFHAGGAARQAVESFGFLSFGIGLREITLLTFERDCP